MPGSFYVDVSTQPIFNDPNEVEPYESGDYTARRQTEYPWLQMSTMLRDCTTLYWRVIGDVNQDDNNPVWGTPSEIHTFRVDTGQCPTATLTYIPPTIIPKITTAPYNPPPVSCSGLSESQCKSTPDSVWDDPSPTGAAFCR